MISITSAALKRINHVLSIKQGMSPVLVLHNGGCLGNVLAIELREYSDQLTKVDIDDLIIFISAEASKFIDDDLLIDIKSGIGDNIIVRNRSAKNICKCGKSFGV